MKRIELVKFNAGLFQNLKSAGVKIEDCDYIAIYDEYAALIKDGVKRTAVAEIVGEHHGITPRQIYNIINRLNEEV